jgi:hypothetical protein
MKNRDTNQPEALVDRVLAAGGVSKNEKKSSSESGSGEEEEAQLKSHKRSREVALMKLAFLRPDENDPE